MFFPPPMNLIFIFWVMFIPVEVVLAIAYKKAFILCIQQKIEIKKLNSIKFQQLILNFEGSFLVWDCPWFIFPFFFFFFWFLVLSTFLTPNNHQFIQDPNIFIIIIILPYLNLKIKLYLRILQDLIKDCKELTSELVSEPIKASVLHPMINTCIKMFWWLGQW